MDREMPRKWLKAGCLKKQVLQSTEDGAPEGGIISPVQAKSALDGMERMLSERLRRHVKDGFDFLDRNVRDYSGKLLIKPSKRNVAAFAQNIRG
jgi:RNA-directed DNA polymerase